MSIFKTDFKPYFLIALLLFSQKGFAQNFWEKSHLGIGVGAMKYKGDIFNPYTRFAFQANYTYELTDHFNIRGQAFFGSVGASDASATAFNINGYVRPHPFESRIKEASLLVEYNLLNMNEGSKWTPYLFAGAGFFHYQPYHTEYDATANRFYRVAYFATDKRNKLDVPFGGGIKYGLSDNIRLNLETNIRYTTTNDLDGYNPPNEGKDWFYSFTLGISFKLGGDYHSGKSGGNGAKYNSKKCPPIYQ